jgi:hypothetical protein
MGMRSPGAPGERLRATRALCGTNEKASRVNYCIDFDEDRKP